MDTQTAPTTSAWTLAETAFDSAHVEQNGNKFLIGNGYLGLRGTLEEFGASELAACTISGLYDQQGDRWREPVNAPHAFHLDVSVDGNSLSTLDSETVAHEQRLHLSHALHFRSTTYRLPNGKTATVEVERFLSLQDVHLGVMRCRIRCSADCEVELRSATQRDVWDINGSHLDNFQTQALDHDLCLVARTVEKAIPAVVATSLESEDLPDFAMSEADTSHHARFQAEAEHNYQFTKWVATHTGADTATPLDAARATLERARNQGLPAVREAHNRAWQARWTNSDVRIEGDDEAQFALRYSIYQLLIAAPAHGHASIPARGLSGQVYKGAIFWDTEIFMLPFFDHTQPKLARNLVDYRIHTLDGARRKAEENGFRGAFYAWESQESGDDACTFFNVTDVVTGRPMRTYFRDKQIHVSADVALAIWRHYQMTGTLDVLTSGGAEVILECARFFYSYASFKPDRDRYEIHDVVGPDEYHERVHNNAFTNAMVKAMLHIAGKVAALLQENAPEVWQALEQKLDIVGELEAFQEMERKLYQPAPDSETQVIEQFDGYHRLEDQRPEPLKERLLNPNEYWGGGNGIATTTKVIKQADVVLMLHLFSANHSAAVKQANWEYYEPRTEHGSSLSPCVYALLAAELGKTEWAYKYFLRTATIDLTGKSKQFVGDLYIGGTHPAANGGAWMAAILGFAGLRTGEATIQIRPQLPENWTRLRFRFCKQAQWFTVQITADAIVATGDTNNTRSIDFDLNGEYFGCGAGERIQNEF